MVSSVRPQRGSRATSSTGARPWCTPTSRRLDPIAAATRPTSSGSNAAPQASGVGNTVACHAVKPDRHSSCARAGMPSLDPVTMLCWVRASAWAARVGSTGAVPKTRVSCPSPCRTSSSQAGSGSAISCWAGATSWPVCEAPAQTPTSWATFSSSVITATSSATRCWAGRAGSAHRAPDVRPGRVSGEPVPGDSADPFWAESVADAAVTSGDVGITGGRPPGSMLG
jgi:hypothetical protein